jgi:hypothetical protein
LTVEFRRYAGIAVRETPANETSRRSLAFRRAGGRGQRHRDPERDQRGAATTRARRKGIEFICHGASEFAHENTLETFRATFELGGDGNEIDIRATSDGVLVCFHDDMLDQRLQANGDMANWTCSGAPSATPARSATTAAFRR